MLSIAGKSRGAEKPSDNGQPPAVSLLETGYPETPWEPRDGQHFGISKGRLVRGRLPPVRQRGRGGQEIVHKDVEFGQVML